MGAFTIPELAALGNQFFTGQRSPDDVFDPYTVQDFIDGLTLCLNTIESRLRGINPAQFQFRIPGVPEGPDWNHDQHHFNASELVTHLTGSLRGWAQILVDKGLPIAPIPEVLPPPTQPVTGGGRGPGGGGRADLTLDQTLLELRTTRDHLAQSLPLVSQADWSQPYVSPFAGPIQLRHLVMLMGVHSAAHTFQLMEIQAHDEYPTT